MNIRRHPRDGSCQEFMLFPSASGQEAGWVPATLSIAAGFRRCKGRPGLTHVLQDLHYDSNSRRTRGTLESSVGLGESGSPIVINLIDVGCVFREWALAI